MFNFIGKRKYWFIFSGVLAAVSLVSLIVWGLNLGIDFTGGSLLEVKITGVEVSIDQIKTVLSEQGIINGSVQSTGDDVWLIRAENISEATHQAVLDGLKENLLGTEPTTTASLSELQFTSIGPTIGNELKGKAITSIVIVLIAIIIYIALAFRKVSFPVESWKYGIVAIVALAHDIFITVGLFSILGHFLNYQVDSLIVTALLTILGFSVHDTIVTFDRIRESLFKSRNLTFADVVNKSINETLVRSLSTSLTTFLVLIAVYLFGGESINHFVLALAFGVIIGTYSSIFLASPLLVVWYNKKVS
jgi:preprotein translocase subunit SecF